MRSGVMNSTGGFLFWLVRLVISILASVVLTVFLNLTFSRI